MRPLRFALILCLCVCSAVRAADPTPIELREPGTNLFADRKTEFMFELKRPADFKGRLTWSFTAANDRAIEGGRGEAAVVGKGAEAVVVKTALTTPTVNTGVVLETKLTVSLIADGADKPDATLATTLWIFPPEAFADRNKWLKDLAIVVFDPSEKSPTVEAFEAEALKIPHTVLREVAKLADIKEGIVVVGSGVSFKEEKGLAEALVQCAQRGCRCLCLAATDGNFPLPGLAAEGKLATTMTFQRSGIIHKLDKRLDPQTWGGKNPLTHSIHLAVNDGEVTGEIREDAKGWPWIQAEFDGGGKLVFCQFALIKHWDSSPTPRYLFAKILESLAPGDDLSPPK